MFSGKSKQLCVFVGETDRYQHQSLFNAVLELLRRHGCAGATAFRGLAGFGASSVMHSTSVLALSMDLPVIVVAVDRPERIERVLAPLREMAPRALIVTHDVETVQFPAFFHEILPALKVSEVMSKDVATVHPDNPPAQVLDLLLERDFTAVPVIDAEGRVVGMISDYDLLNRAPATPIDSPQATGSQFVRELRQALLDPRRKVAELMSTPVETAAPDMSLADAAGVMVIKGLKRLPVVDGGGKLIGVLGRMDLLNTIAPAPLPAWHPQTPAAGIDAAVADVMARTVSTIDETTGLETVFQLLVAAPHKRLVVVDDSRHVLGIIADCDLLARLSQKNQPGMMAELAADIPIKAVSEPARRYIQKAHAQSAAELMTREVITVRDTTPAADALLLSAARRIKRLPVVDADGKLAGIVGRAELMRALLARN